MFLWGILCHLNKNNFKTVLISEEVKVNIIKEAFSSTKKKEALKKNITKA
jgi:hypothetical protein